MTGALIVIPARMEASRLPGKPLADIAGEPMIVHVWRRAMEADAGDVVVATDSEDIAASIKAAGGEAVMTRKDHMSGSDRVFEAVSLVDPGGTVETIVNLQGDLPALAPGLIRTCIAPLSSQDTDIATLAAEITDPEERGDPSVVKAVATPLGGDGGISRALYFTRATAPYGDGPLYHHIGLYAYERQALERFVRLPRSPLEIREKLEQLRALEAGMRIDIALVDTIPLGVDTPADLERVRALIGSGVSMQSR